MRKINRKKTRAQAKFIIEEELSTHYIDWWDYDDWYCTCDDCTGMPRSAAAGNWVEIVADKEVYYTHIDSLSAVDFERLGITKENVLIWMTSEDEVHRRVAKKFWTFLKEGSKNNLSIQRR